MCRHSIAKHSLLLCERTRPARARSRNFSPLHGRPELSATRSTSIAASSLTTAAVATNMLNSILPLRSPNEESSGHAAPRTTVPKDPFEPSFLRRFSRLCPGCLRRIDERLVPPVASPYDGVQPSRATPQTNSKMKFPVVTCVSTETARHTTLYLPGFKAGSETVSKAAFD